MKIEKIKVRGNGKVNITSSNKDCYDIIAHESVKKYIEVTEKEGMLYINTKNPLIGINSLFRKKEIIINIKCKDLSEVDLGGALEINMKKINEEEMIINNSGSITMTIRDVFVGKLNLNINGNGYVNLDGNGEVFEGSINGNGAIEGNKFKVKKARVNITGHGEVYINCHEELEGSIVGAGNISYLGEAKIVGSKLFGLGKMLKIKEMGV